MRTLLAFCLLVALAAIGLLAAFVVSGRASALAPGDIALAINAVRSTPDAAATRAIATFEAALLAPPAFGGPSAATVETPAPAATPTPTGTPMPTATAVPTATPTPKRAATAMALRRQVNTAVAATLTAQPTATLQPAATPTPLIAAQPDAPPNVPPALAELQMIGVVDGGGLVNLRSGPGLDFPVLMGVNSGEEVVILGRNQGADWLQIRTAGGTLGWMAAMYVRTGQAAESYPVVGESPAGRLP